MCDVFVMLDYMSLYLLFSCHLESRHPNHPSERRLRHAQFHFAEFIGGRNIQFKFNGFK